MLTPVQVLQVVTFLDALAAGLIFPQLPNHARILGCNHILIGTMGALYSGFQLLSGPVVKVWITSKSKKALLLQSLLLCGTAYVFLGITSSIVLFLATRAFIGLFKHSQILTKTLTPVFENNENNQKGVFANLGLLTGVGMALGPAISGNIVEILPNYGFTLIAIIVSGIFAANSGLINSLPGDKKEKPKDDKKTQVLTPVEAITNSLIYVKDEILQIDWNVYKEVYLYKSLAIFTTGVFLCNFALFLKMKHKISSSHLGYVASYFGIINLSIIHFSKQITGYLKNDKLFKDNVFYVFVVMSVSLLGLIVAPTIPIYLIFVTPLIICNGVARILTSEMIMKRSESGRKDMLMGVVNSIQSTAGVMAPLVAGFVGQYFGSLNVIYVPLALAATGVHLANKSRTTVVISKEEKKSN